MTVFEAPAFDDHEQVLFVNDSEVGLRGIIAIHNTARGPALGGCRMWPYASEDEALTDALRLARGMTFKSALADLPFGGGKSVIIGDPHKDKSDTLLLAMAGFVESLGGRYIIAEDVGAEVADMDEIAKETRHVSGLSGGVGDPSPWTAEGVFLSLQAAVRQRLERDLAGVRVAVTGLEIGRASCRERV